VFFFFHAPSFLLAIFVTIVFLRLDFCCIMLVLVHYFWDFFMFWLSACLSFFVIVYFPSF
jgi:hypothetical protein